MATHALSRALSRGNPTPMPGDKGKRQTPLLAIQAFCRACMGSNPLLVGACASTSCKFHQYRCGTIEAGADRRLLRIIKTYCTESCLPTEDAANCVAGQGYLGMASCPLWAYRQGRNPARAGMGKRENLGAFAAPRSQPVSRSRIDESDQGHTLHHHDPQVSFLNLLSPRTESATSDQPMEASHV